MQMMKNFREEIFAILAYFGLVSLLLYLYYFLKLWKVLNASYSKIIEVYLQKMLHVKVISKGLELTLVISNQAYHLRLSPECSAIDIGLIFALATLVTRDVSLKDRILGLLEILLATYVINILRLLATLYFLFISEDLFIVMHQVIFRTLMFLVLPGIYLSWYHGRTNDAN
jgi:exosortase/archaeosortase family protein